MRSRSGLMTSRQLSWQANAAKPIGQSAYRRLSPHKNNRNRRQRKVEINRKKINENMFIDVICCVMGRKLPDQIRSGRGSILAITLPPAVAQAELGQST